MTTRIKILKRLAQLSQTPVPTETTAKETVLAAPPSFQASSAYPNIRTGYNSQSVQIIDSLISLLNNAIYYTTAGALNFLKFKENGFNFDASSAASTDQKNIMLFSKKVFQLLLNNGNTFDQPLTGQQVTNIANTLNSSIELSSLAQTAPTSTLSIKIQGNLKTLISSYLEYLKLANPINRT